MPDLDDARTIALSMPGAVEVVSYGHVAWTAGANFAWERPFTKADVKRDGEQPSPLLVAVRVADFDEKAALLAAEPDVLTSIQHFDRFTAVLIRMDRVSLDRLRELIIESWLAVAPKAAVEKYLADE